MKPLFVSGFFLLSFSFLKAQTNSDTFRFPTVLGAAVEAASSFANEKPDNSNRSIVNLPSKKDLSPFCPTPRKQNYADCVGWAVAYSAVGIKRAILNGVKNPKSAQALALDPLFVYKNIRPKPNNDCYQTSNINEAFQWIKTHKTPPFKIDNYDCSKKSDALATPNLVWNKRWRIYNYEKNSGSRLKFIKENLAQGSPVVACLKHKNGGHAVCLLSYDDKTQRIGFSDSGSGTITSLGYNFFENESDAPLVALASSDEWRGDDVLYLSNEEIAFSPIRFSEENKADNFLRFKHQTDGIYKIVKDCPNNSNYILSVDVPSSIFCETIGLSTSDRGAVHEFLNVFNATDSTQVFSKSIRLDAQPAHEFFVFIFSNKKINSTEIHQQLAAVNTSADAINDCMKKYFGALVSENMRYEANGSQILINPQLSNPVWFIVDMNHVH